MNKQSGVRKIKLDTKKLQITMARQEFGVIDLAEKTGISKSTISKYVRGIIAPTIKSLGKMANALNVDVTEILED